MKKSTIAAAITAIAIAVLVPFALAQTTSGSDAAPPAAASRNYQTGPGMMGGQAQVPDQSQAQGAYAPGAKSAYGQGQDGFGPGLMSGYGAGWMGGSGGIWVLILLVIGGVGLLAWVVRQEGN